MSSPIVEILSGAAAHVLHVARGPQRPYSEKSKNPKFRRNNKNPKIWPCLFSYETAYFPLKGEPCTALGGRYVIEKLPINRTSGRYVRIPIPMSMQNVRGGSTNNFHYRGAHSENF